ncbi:hypothetical protein V494_06114 [Pseudogymnoascus sp. VKM F-4513 (FW-928)]|nr:hypothetical protein V494_06114 [Pseudogymnoascus sp. VKM F-4513 (FW-928)]
MAFQDGYPDATFVNEPDSRHPLFMNGHIDNNDNLAPNLPEPISTEDLDILHALKSDADMGFCIDEWTENSMFETAPSSKLNPPADNSDIDNFLREYREFSRSGLNSAENVNSSAGQRNPVAHPNNLELSAATNSNGLIASRANMARKFENLGPFPTSQGPDISQSDRNTANVGAPPSYPRPGRPLATPNKKSKRASASKLSHDPPSGPKSRVERTTAKATHRHKLGKSNPVSRQRATGASAAPSVPNEESPSKPPNSSAESVSSLESETTRTESSKSRASSGSSHSSPPDTPKGPAPAPKDPPAPGSGGSTKQRKADAANRAANGKTSGSSITVKRKTNRGTNDCRSKTCTIGASVPHTDCGSPSKNGGNGKNSSISNGASLSNVATSWNNEHWFNLGDNIGPSKMEVQAGGFNIHDNSVWQNGAAPPVMNDMNDPQVYSGQLQPHGQMAHNGPAIQNRLITTYVPPYSLPSHNDPALHYTQAMQSGQMASNGAAIQNGPMPQKVSPTHFSQSNSGPIPPYDPSMQNGQLPLNGFQMESATMQFNNAPTQNYPAAKDASYMHNDQMPPYAPPMQNGAVPPNGYPMQNGYLVQNSYPMQNGYTTQNSYSMQNGWMPHYIQPTQNDPVSEYHYPVHNGFVPPYGPPTHNGSVPQQWQK